MGGVGSWAAESLARSGVGRLTLIDLDHVAESNINRQVQALGATVGMAKVEAFVVAPWQGVLCLFLLDMGLVAGRGLRGARGIVGAGLVAFGVVMPMMGAAAGLGAALAAPGA